MIYQIEGTIPCACRMMKNVEGTFFSFRYSIQHETASFQSFLYFQYKKKYLYLDVGVPSILIT